MDAVLSSLKWSLVSEEGESWAFSMSVDLILRDVDWSGRRYVPLDDRGVLPKFVNRGWEYQIMYWIS